MLMGELKFFMKYSQKSSFPLYCSFLFLFLERMNGNADAEF